MQLYRTEKVYEPGHIAHQLRAPCTRSCDLPCWRLPWRCRRRRRKSKRRKQPARQRTYIRLFISAKHLFVAANEAGIHRTEIDCTATDARATSEVLGWDPVQPPDTLSRGYPARAVASPDPSRGRGGSGRLLKGFWPVKG